MTGLREIDFFAESANKSAGECMVRPEWSCSGGCVREVRQDRDFRSGWRAIMLQILFSLYAILLKLSVVHWSSQ